MELEDPLPVTQMAFSFPSTPQQPHTSALDDSACWSEAETPGTGGYGFKQVFGRCGWCVLILGSVPQRITYYKRFKILNSLVCQLFFLFVTFTMTLFQYNTILIVMLKPLLLL